jgi:WD40-like Beta Propeller Repeat
MGKHAVTGALLMLACLMSPGGLVQSQGPTPPKDLKAGARQDTGSPAISDEAGRLIDQLKKHPARRSGGNEKHGLYLIDVEQGAVTLIADEPTPGLTHCGSARWSQDGKRILFDATPGSKWNQAHIFVIEAGEVRPKVTDLGPGNCPSPSPDGKLVAFLLNNGAVPGAGSGLWVMNADGSGRQPLGSYGRPYWSPDNRQVLIVSFSEPCRLTLMDVETRKIRSVEVPGQQVSSIPSWVDRNTLVASLGTGDERTIALIDVTDPEHGKIKEVLREKDDKPKVIPAYPVYLDRSRLGFFVNANPKGMSLYSIQQGKSARPKRLERDGFDKLIADIAASPDGRHLIFCSDRPAPKSP